MEVLTARSNVFALITETEKLIEGTSSLDELPEIEEGNGYVKGGCPINKPIVAVGGNIPAQGDLIYAVVVVDENNKNPGSMGAQDGFKRRGKHRDKRPGNI